MKPDELRALADAIVYRDSLAIARAADYLRACADEKPVGYVTANGLRSLRQDDATVLLYAHDYLIRPDHVALYTRPAPVAPQAEPKREPLSDWRIGELHRQWLANPETVTIADLMRAAERAAYEHAADIVHHLSEYPPEHIAKVIRALGGSDGN